MIFPGFMQRMCRRRNCRCQTSDYVVIWQSAGGKCRRREEKQKQDERSERFGRKNAHVRGKVGKSRRTVFVQSVVAPESRKVGSQKRRASSLVARWEGNRARCCGAKQRYSRRHKHVTSGAVLGVHWLKTCTALWHELHVREKVGKSRRSLFFQSAGAPEGRKVCSQKRWARSHLARWEGAKTWTLLRRSRVGSQESRS